MVRESSRTRHNPRLVPNNNSQKCAEMTRRGERKDLWRGAAIVAPPNLSRRLFSSGVPLFGAACLLTALTVSAPLATYTVALAVLGLPHVLSELRYVDRRLGRRLDRGLLLPILLLLPMIVAIRASWVLHLVPTGPGLCGELFGVALLALTCARGSGARKTVAIAVAAVLGGATAINPYATAVTLSILHNLTPLGFLWQIAPRAQRTRIMVQSASLFLGLPLLTATGCPRMAMERFARPIAAADPLHAGQLADNLFVYVPASLLTTSHAVDLFSASVVAQIAHYGAVIIILPLLSCRLDARARGLFPWPNGTVFAILIAVGGLVVLAGFFADFAEARSLYGIVAAFHAWLEIPVLILALTGAGQRSSYKPNSADAELATSDTSNGDHASPALGRRPLVLRPSSILAGNCFLRSGRRIHRGRTHHLDGGVARRPRVAAAEAAATCRAPRLDQCNNRTKRKATGASIVAEMKRASLSLMKAGAVSSCFDYPQMHDSQFTRL